MFRAIILPIFRNTRLFVIPQTVTHSLELQTDIKQNINLDLSKDYEIYSFVIGPYLFTCNVQCRIFSCQDQITWIFSHQGHCSVIKHLPAVENIGEEIVKTATRMRMSLQALNQITEFCEICWQIYFSGCHTAFPPFKSTVFCDEKPTYLIRCID